MSSSCCDPVTPLGDSSSLLTRISLRSKECAGVSQGTCSFRPDAEFTRIREHQAIRETLAATRSHCKSLLMESYCYSSKYKVLKAELHWLEAEEAKLRVLKEGTTQKIRHVEIEWRLHEAHRDAATARQAEIIELMQKEGVSYGPSSYEDYGGIDSLEELLAEP